MIELEIIPRYWLSWDCNVLKEGSPVAEIETMFGWRQKGILRVCGRRYVTFREGLACGTFILTQSSAPLARAMRTHWFSSSFVIEVENRKFDMKADFLGRSFTLLENGQEVGSIARQGIFTRRADARFLETLAMSVQVFIIWLAIITWKRNQSAG